ncbi:MAG: hypothetical protein NUW00_04725, partial [Candidatus Kaiserbacteria bacterium]|nr:hypothetical protein [Candidatus Kaiserbacteria bacterium]
MTRVQAKSFYDALGGASPRFTGMAVTRILRNHGRCVGQLLNPMTNRQNDVWVLKKMHPSLKKIFQ